MQTLSTLLAYRAFVTPNKSALQLGIEKITYSQLNNLSNQFANYLQQQGFKKGDKLGIISLNSLHVPVILYGALKAGVVPVQLNWWVTPTDIEKLYAHAEIKKIVYGSSFQELLIKTSESIEKKSIESIVPELSSVSNTFEDTTSPNDDAFQIYTSGTTGIPKGTILTHENLISLAQNITNEFPGFGCTQISLIAVPIFNIAGLGYLIVTIINGGTSVLLPSFDGQAVLKSLSTDGITNIFLPPALIFALCQHIPDTIKFDSLKLLHYGGAPISTATLKLAQSKFKCDLIQGYGLTETSGIISLLRVEDHKNILENENLEYVGSAGKIVAGVEIKIIKENGEEADQGEVGELLVRGNNIMKGYWKTDNTQYFEKDWFKTGDYARQDAEGYLYIVDRKNDLIITKGINVYPSEIEKILIEHPQIEQVCVLAMPSESYGDIITAAVVTLDSSLTKEHLEEWTRNRLSGFKLPRQWYFVKELPKNLAGKVVRKQLKDQILNN